MYESYWQLSEPPFDNSPNPKFFYLSPEHEEALVRLVYTVRHRKGCGMLIGEYGCGKTTLSRALIQRLEAERYEIGLLTNPSWTAVDFLREILYQLGHGDGGEEQARAAAQALRRRLRQLPRGPRHRRDGGRGAADRGRGRVRGAAVVDELPDRRPLPGDDPADRLAGAGRQGPPPQAPRPAHRHPRAPQRAGCHPHRQLHRPPPEDGRPHRAGLHAPRRSSSSSTSPAARRARSTTCATSRCWSDSPSAPRTSARRSSPRSSRTWWECPDGAHERSGARRGPRGAAPAGRARARPGRRAGARRGADGSARAAPAAPRAGRRAPAARPGAASPGGGARDLHRAQRGLRTVARPAPGPAARGARPRADPARFPLAAPGGSRRPRRHLAGALAGPVLGGQQSGRAPRRGLPGLSSGAGGRHGDAHRREHRLRSPPAPRARARRLPDRRRTLANAGDPAATDRLADRRRAGGLSRPPAGVGRHRPALGALQRAHHPGRPRAPRARAGPGLPAGADRRARSTPTPRSSGWPTRTPASPCRRAPARACARTRRCATSSSHATRASRPR